MAVTVPDKSGEPEASTRLLTKKQLAERHPALAGRIPHFVVRADRGDPDYVGLRRAIVRIGRSVYIDEPPFEHWLNTLRGAAPDQPRNPHGRGGAARLDPPRNQHGRAGRGTK